jgi:hypothetical protein
MTFSVFKNDTSPVPTAVDIRKWKSLASKGIQLSTENGVVPTKSEGNVNGFYFLRKWYIQFFKYLTLNTCQFRVL